MKSMAVVIIGLDCWAPDCVRRIAAVGLVIILGATAQLVAQEPSRPAGLAEGRVESLFRGTVFEGQSWVDILDHARAGKLQGDHLLAYCRLLRAGRAWGEAAAYCNLWLEENPEPGALRERVTSERDANARLASGWRPNVDDLYVTMLDQIAAAMPAADTEETERFLSEIAAMEPARWQAHALRAQNFLRSSRLNESRSAIATAIELGGTSARESVTELVIELERQTFLEERVGAAKRAVDAGDLGRAAEILENAWKVYPQSVELALEAARLRANSKNFSGAARICLDVVDYLKANPTHAIASKVAEIVAIAEQCKHANNVAGRISASSPKSPPPKAAQRASARRSSGSDGNGSSQGSMADKFRRGTNKK